MFFFIYLLRNILFMGIFPVRFLLNFKKKPFNKQQLSYQFYLKSSTVQYFVSEISLCFSVCDRQTVNQCRSRNQNLRRNEKSVEPQQDLARGTLHRKGCFLAGKQVRAR
jgi:hypothetical protein